MHASQRFWDKGNSETCSDEVQRRHDPRPALVWAVVFTILFVAAVAIFALVLIR
jgi:hypothetical protein